jgi:hypothetical protein
VLSSAAAQREEAMTGVPTIDLGVFTSAARQEPWSLPLVFDLA